MARQDDEIPQQRLERRPAQAPQAAAASASAQVRDQLRRAEAPVETRGRPADAATVGLSRDEIAERTNDENFIDNPELLTRRSLGEHEIEYSIPKHLQRPGWEYEFKARSVLGEPVNSSVVARERNQGWRPVPASDVAELLPPGYDKPTYEIDGLVAVMRPRRLQVEARNEMMAKADKQKRDKLQQALVGDSQHPLMPRESWGPQGPRRGAPLIEGEIGTYRPREEGA